MLCYADVLTEIKTICSCGRKATMNQRIRSDGTPLAAGEQIEVGGNERYVGKCRRHFQEGLDLAQGFVEKGTPAAAGTWEGHQNVTKLSFGLSSTCTPVSRHATTLLHHLLLSLAHHLHQ